MSDNRTTPASADKRANAARLPQGLSLFAALCNRRLHKSELSLMMESLNPLWQIDMKRAQLIYDYARRGNFAQLQFLYNEIENCDPTFMTCVSRRCSAISESDWRVVRSSERLNRRSEKNESLAKEQIEFVETAIAKIDNLPDALEHFALSAFRGFSVCNIHFGGDNMPQHLECLDHWNVCYDRFHRQWKWNPGASSFIDPSLEASELSAFPSEDVIVVSRKRQIDWPALQIFLRISVGERDWGKFLETYGLPPVIITMPPFTNEKEQDAYLKAAESVFEGKNGVVPNGSEVNYAAESRGVNPFDDFIDHNMKLYVLLATGGTLTSLAESGSGTLAGNAQMDVWEQIVRSDKRLISNAFNKQLCEQLVRSCPDFEGYPVLAEFQLDNEPKKSAKEILELASTAYGAGLEMDIDEISQATGFTFRRRQEGGGMGFNGSPTPDKPVPPDGGGSVTIPDFPQTVTNKDDAPPGEQPKDAPRTAQDAPGAQGGISDKADAPNAVEGAPGASDAKSGAAGELAESLQEDFKPIADRLNAILALPEEERATAASKLLLEIDSLVPDDPAMAEVIDEQMREAFGLQVAKGPGAGVANARPLKDGERWVTPSSGGSPFIIDRHGKVVGGGEAAKSVAEAEAASDKGKRSIREMSHDDGEGLSEEARRSLKKGHSAVDDIISKKQDVLGAMSDADGEIDFYYDRGGMGFKHLIERRNAFCEKWRSKHPDSNPITGEEMARIVPSIIVRGERKTEGMGLRADTVIRHNGFKVVLTPSFDGKPTKRWVLTGMELDPNASGYRSEREFGKNSETVFAGKGVNLLRATHPAPTRASSQGGGVSKT